MHSDELKFKEGKEPLAWLAAANGWLPFFRPLILSQYDVSLVDLGENFHVAIIMRICLTYIVILQHLCFQYVYATKRNQERTATSIR